jgi:hypothetical protein
MSAFHGSNVKAILDALSGATGVLHEIGTDADAKLSREDRVVWIPRASTIVRATEQPEDGKACATRRIRFDVMVYASDFDAQTRLEDTLISGGLVTFSEGGFDPFGRESAYSGGTAEAPGFARPVPVVLLVPVYEQAFIAGTIGAPDQSGQVVNTQGENPELVGVSP